MYHYIIQGKSRIFSFKKQMNDVNNRVGRTIEDYRQGKWILLNENQCDFAELNPTAQGEEILNCQPKVKQQVPQPSYSDLVERKIREKYSQSDVEAILRKKIAGNDDGEFDEFNLFCETCKNEVKESMS
jgi:hypothetical protein